MNVCKKYFDFVVTGDKFYIVESDLKPKGSALSTLAKIEAIVQKELSYDNNKKDDRYSKLPAAELFRLLREKAFVVNKGYDEKQAKLNWFFRFLFSRKKQISKIYSRIESHIDSKYPPVKLGDLPSDLFVLISGYLSFSDMGRLAQVNKRVNVRLGRAFVVDARNLGYKGHDRFEAGSFINTWLKEHRWYIAAA